MINSRELKSMSHLLHLGVPDGVEFMEARIRIRGRQYLFTSEGEGSVIRISDFPIKQRMEWWLEGFMRRVRRAILGRWPQLWDQYWELHRRQRIERRNSLNFHPAEIRPVEGGTYLVYNQCDGFHLADGMRIDDEVRLFFKHSSDEIDEDFYSAWAKLPDENYSLFPFFNRRETEPARNVV